MQNQTTPKQNRVTPWGDIVAVSARGNFMGNRGCLHNPAQQIVRPYQLRRWIICVLEFKNRRRAIMQPGRYTELFFLDEAVALAAGHRPCAECQRSRYNYFRTLWAQANSTGNLPSADAMDLILHAERVNAQRQKLTYNTELAALPDGAFVMLPGYSNAYLVLGDKLLPWQPAGYGAPLVRPAQAEVQVLTPRSIVSVLAQGFRPNLHETAL